jgi:hypothetical protein
MAGSDGKMRSRIPLTASRIAVSFVKSAVIVSVTGRIAARTTDTTGSKTVWIGPRTAWMIGVIDWISGFDRVRGNTKWSPTER